MEFVRATVGDAPAAFRLVCDRVAWMDARGISQWNTTGYTESYPEAYFRARAAAGELFGMADGGRLVGVVVVLGSDPRWDGQPRRTALYVHNLATDWRVGGVGRALVEAARRAAREAGYAFMQVKTVQMGKYAEYDATNRFYLAMGFKEFEVFPHLWDEWNPCQVYVMGL